MTNTKEIAGQAWRRDRQDQEKNSKSYFDSNIKSGPDFGGVMLVDIMIRAESRLERKLAGLALYWPKTILKATHDYNPEVDLAAIDFFKEFKKNEKLIMASTHDKAVDIAFLCWDPVQCIRLFLSLGLECNTALDCQKIVSEITAARTARKAIRWVEESGLIEGVMAYG